LPDIKDGPSSWDLRLVADEPEKFVGVIAAVNCKFANLGEKAFAFLARNSFSKSIKVLQNRIHLLAIKDSIPVRIYVSEHGETMVPYREHTAQQAGGFPNQA
jgi:hypothetical protein